MVVSWLLLCSISNTNFNDAYIYARVKFSQNIIFLGNFTSLHGFFFTPCFFWHGDIILWGWLFYESHCCCLVLSPWCVQWEHFYQVLLLSQCSAARKLLVIESVLHLRWPGRVIKATPTSCRKILCGNRIMGLYQGAWCYFIFPISILWFKKKQWNVLHPSELHDSVLGRTVGLVDHIFNVCDVQDEEKKPFFLSFECDSA